MADRRDDGAAEKQRALVKVHKELRAASTKPVNIERLQRAIDAATTAGAPAVLNAANEIAVSAFLEERIGFLSIPEVVDASMQAHDRQPGDSLEALYEADRWARRKAEDIVTGSGFGRRSSASVGGGS